MTTIYRKLSTEQYEQYLRLKQCALDKTQFFNKTGDEYDWVLSTDTSGSKYAILIESIVFFGIPHVYHNTLFFFRDDKVAEGTSYCVLPCDVVYPRLMDLLTNLKINPNRVILRIPDIYIKAIKKDPAAEPVIDLMEEFDNFKTDASSHLIKRNDVVETETSEPIYRHPRCSGGFDTYLTVVSGYGNMLPNDVLLGTWCTVREVYPDGTIITTDGDKLAPALSTYADIFKTNNIFYYPNLIYYVLAVNSKCPSQKGFSPMRYNDFCNNDPYYSVHRQAQQCVGPYNQFGNKF